MKNPTKWPGNGPHFTIISIEAFFTLAVTLQQYCWVARWWNQAKFWKLILWAISLREKIFYPSEIAGLSGIKRGYLFEIAHASGVVSTETSCVNEAWEWKKCSLMVDHLVQGFHWGCGDASHQVVDHSGLVETVGVEEEVGQLHVAFVRVPEVHLDKSTNLNAIWEKASRQFARNYIGAQLGSEHV